MIGSVTWKAERGQAALDESHERFEAEEIDIAIEIRGQPDLQMTNGWPAERVRLTTVVCFTMLVHDKAAELGVARGPTCQRFREGAYLAIAGVTQEAEGNAAQVRNVRQILEGLGLELASPDEARALLALKGGDQVGF